MLTFVVGLSPFGYGPSLSLTKACVIGIRGYGRRQPSRCNLGRRGSHSTSLAASLEKFAAGVSGEWEGSEATFDGLTGELIPPSEFTIPDEFLEWNIEPKGFQSHNAVTMRNAATLWRKHFRILPCVSSFGDHMDLEEDIFETSTDDPGFTYFSDCGGSYVMSPTALKVRESRLERHPTFEFVLAHHPQKSDDGDRRRSLFRFKLDYEKQRIDQDVQLIQEKYDATFCNGSALDGASGFSAGIGEGAVVSVDDLLPQTRDWTYISQPSVPLPSRWVTGEAASTAMGLPDGMYLLIGKITEEELAIEVGRSAHGCRESLVRRYSTESGALVGTDRVVMSNNVDFRLEPFDITKETIEVPQIEEEKKVIVQETQEVSIDDSLAKFRASVEGEWKGVELSIDTYSNEIINIPDEYIPEEFLEWGVRPNKFESNQASVLRLSSTPITLWRKHFRVIPMTGEDFELEEFVTQHALEASNFVYYDNGAYATGPGSIGSLRASQSSLLNSSLPKTSETAQFEFCVVLKSDQPNTRERAVGRVSVDLRKWRFTGTVQVILEHYEGPFAEGAFVDGSGDSESENMSISSEARSWMASSDASDGHAIDLPNGLFVCVSESRSGEDNVSLFQAGQFLDGTQSSVVSLEYLSGSGSLINGS